MLLDALLESARRVPNAIAVRDPTGTFTFKRILSLAAVIRDLIRAETQKGVVGLILPGGAAATASVFGALWDSRVVVPLNFLLGPGELADIVRDAELDLIITIRHFAAQTADLPARSVFLDELPLKRRVLARMFRPKPPVPKTDPNTPAVLLYTSGTSGTCKGVELTHRNLRANADAIIDAAELRDDDRFLCVLPPFHVFGLTGNIFVPAVRGLPTEVIPRFSPAAVLRAARENRPTVLMAIPSMYAALLRTKSADADTFASLRLPISGGEPLPDSVADGFRDRFGIELLEGYGLTETSPVVSLNRAGRSRRGTVGIPLSNVEVRIVRADGVPAAVGEEGEITVRSPSVMNGYRNRPQETADVLNSDGWFRTGDLGAVDEDGFLKICGRKKELIIVGGENVYPREIENVLLQHPAVAEVAVIGVPDQSRGELPSAFVVAEPDAHLDEMQLRNFARSHLAGYKVPRTIHVVEELPKGPTGKVLKRELRAPRGAPC